MKLLNIVVATLLLCVNPLQGVDAKRKPCYIMVDEFGEPYKGKCSWFRINKNAAINPKADNYVAMRWDYKALAKHWGIEGKRVRGRTAARLRNCWVLIENPKNGKHVWGRCADWGPAKWTGRHIDLDPDIMDKIDCVTDDVLIATLYEDRSITQSVLRLSLSGDIQLDDFLDLLRKANV